MYCIYVLSKGDLMHKSLIIQRKSIESSDLDTNIVSDKQDLLEDFDETKVEPLNFIRRSLLEINDECLSYL